MSTNRSSLRTPDDIQAMLEDASGASAHSTAAAAAASAASAPSSNSGESQFLEGSLLSTLKEENRRRAMMKGASKSLPAMLITSSSIDELCCGFIGTHKKQFCLKPKSSCSVYKNQGLHYSSAFQPLTDTYYVCKSVDQSAGYCDLFVKRESLDPKIIQDLDNGSTRTVEEWKELMSSTPNTSSKSVSQSILEFSIEALQAFDVAALLTSTPSKLSAQGLGQDTKTDVLSVDASSTSFKKSSGPLELKPKSSAVTPSQSILKRATDIKEKTMFLSEEESSETDENNKTFALFNQRLLMLEHAKTDSTKLHSIIQRLQDAIGHSSLNLSMSLWEAIDGIWNNIDGVDLEDLKESLDRVSVNLAFVQNESVTQSSYWEALTKNWLPRISSLETTSQDLKFKLNELLKGNSSPNQNHQNLNSILHQSLSGQNTTTQASDPLITQLQSTIQDLTTKVSNLEHINHQPQPFNNVPPSLSLSGVCYRQYYFKDPMDLETWMRTNMSHASHGLFVDLVSFSEFFGAERYIERNTTLNEVYMSSKIGYATIADSIVASSFQNVLPGAYGRPISSSKSNELDLTAQAELPGMPTFAKWDNRDGRNGRRYWIREETRKTEQQLDGCICAQLSGQAQLLAKDLLMDSYSMSDCLYTFISTSFEDTMHSGRFDQDQAWTLTCSFVKRIFQEISLERVIARDGIDVDDHWATSAKFLFATLKAHSVMSESMKLSIKDHPSISSEMVKFVCYSQPSTDSTELLSRISGLESMQRADQSNISKIETRLKRVETWKGESEKLLKKLKEKTGV